MTSTINNAFVEQYKKNVILLAQQKGSKQRMTVNNTDVVGRSFYVDAIGSVEVQPITTRHGDTPILDTPHDRRQGLLGPYDWGDMIDDIDKIRMLIDPTSTYVESAGMAFGRKMDTIINTALLGDARAGMTGQTSVPLPTSQKLGLSTNRAMDLDMLLDINQLFDEGDIDPDEEKYLAISPLAKRNLLDTTEVTNSDYATVKALVQGQIDTFMGFKFITTNRLTLDGDDKRHCIAYTKDSLTLGIGAEPKVRISENPGKRFNTQVYMMMSLGAVRIQESMVVESLVYEGA